MSSHGGEKVGTTPKQWSGQRVLMKKSFDSDDLALRDGYTVEGDFYQLGDEIIPRKSSHFTVMVTTKTLNRGWIRFQMKIPVVYGDPWKEELKAKIERELRCNHDLIGVFLSDVDQTWSKGLELSWEDYE